jgi:hypothetical protein
MNEIIKNILKAAAVVAVCGVTAISALGTGNAPVNSPQSGIQTFAGSNLTATVTFAPTFTIPPVVQASLYNSATNYSPVTVSSITTSNFLLTITTNATATVIYTNTGGSIGSIQAAVQWSAFQGWERIITGSNVSLTATSPTNYTFSTPFFYPPVVLITPLSVATNFFPYAVTTTNFYVTNNTGVNVGFNWMAIGQSAIPALNNPTPNDPAF